MNQAQEPKEPSHHRQLRIVFLVKMDDQSTRTSVEAVCRVSGVQPIAVLVDTHRALALQRMKSLRRNFQKEGWRYLPTRLAEGLRAVTDTLTDRAVVSRAEVRAVLRRAFPERCFTMDELGAK
jgi:hypothetical protein